MSDFTLPGFELLEKLGEGGMGQVWKARQLSLDRLVAIKLLPQRFSKNPEAISQIMQEARTAAKLKHPGIVQVYDANEHEGSFFFVMEYVAGYTVSHWIKRKTVLKPTDALTIVDSVARALHYAWRTSGLIHCDLKPDNIMVDQDGSIKVADMGLSVTHDTQAKEPADEVAGTPGYMSPEQVTGAVKLDCRTDIYALGCCLYHMVTGHRPFEKIPDAEAMEAQVNSFIPDPRDFVPSVPPAVCNLIERMLVKDREKRIADWQGVLAAVQRAAKGLVLPGPAPEENASTMRRHAIQAPAMAGEPLPAEKKGKKSVYALAALATVLAVIAVYGFLGKRGAPAPEVVLPVVPLPPPQHPIAPRPAVAAPEPAERPAETPAQANPARTEKIRQANIDAARDSVRRAVVDYESEGKLLDAVNWLEHYDDEFVPETAELRASLVAELRQKIQAKKAETDWQALAAELSQTILAGKYSAARQLLDVRGKDPRFDRHQTDVVAIGSILQDISALNDRVLETFSESIGKSVDLPLVTGRFSGLLSESKERTLIFRTHDGSGQVVVKIDDITPAERLNRLGLVNRPEAYLVRGVLAWCGGKVDSAVELLGKTGPVLSPMLSAAMQNQTEAARQAVLMADPAYVAFSLVLKRSGLVPGPYDPQKWQAVISAFQGSPELAQQVDQELDAFLETHGYSEFVEKNTGLILALRASVGQCLPAQDKDLDSSDDRPKSRRAINSRVP